MNIGDTVMGMSLDHGGHLTHGSPANFSGTYFNIVPYGVNKDGFIEYEIDHASEYFASMSNVNTKNISYKSSPKMTVLSIVEGVIILGLGYAFYALYIGKKSKK